MQAQGSGYAFEAQAYNETEEEKDFTSDAYNQRCSSNYQFEAVKPKKVTASVSDFRQKFKTEICRNWEMSKCKFGPECVFAHGYHELQQKNHIHSNYRTRECLNFYNFMYCSYGNRCQFYHSDKPVLSPPKPPRPSYASGITSVSSKQKQMEDLLGDSEMCYTDYFEAKAELTSKLTKDVQAVL